MRDLILTLIIWIICFTAIVIGVSLTYKWYTHLGKDIYIHFNDVSGLVPNQSKIMYLGVDIGTINEIELDHKTGKPKIKARINKKSMPFLGPDSIFWVVRPELGIGAIHNLSAISTGDYVAVHPVPGEFTAEFKGYDASPIDNEFDAGLRVVLKSSYAAGIDVGSGVFYKGLEIGDVGEMTISPDGKCVLLTIYINKPYDKVIRKSSIFGNVSGFYADVHLFGGTKVTLDSVRTLIKGGIEVVTNDLKAPQAKNGDVFRLMTKEQFNELQEN